MNRPGFQLRMLLMSAVTLAACAVVLAPPLVWSSRESGEDERGGEMERQTTVGATGRLDQLILPGPQLRPRPANHRTAPVIVRVVNTWPHGDAFRYDLEYMGLEPGSFDLRDYLERIDGEPLDDLPSIPVRIVTVLPEGHVLPHELASSWPWLGSYRAWVIAGFIVWVAGLLVLIFVGRRRRAGLNDEHRSQTFAELLAPRLAAAEAGELGTRQLAELERFLVEFWRRKLGISDLAPGDLVLELRRHEEAGPLLVQLEQWIHSPHRDPDVKLDSLLAPYRRFEAGDVDIDKELRS